MLGWPVFIKNYQVLSLLTSQIYPHEIGNSKLNLQLGLENHDNGLIKTNAHIRPYMYLVEVEDEIQLTNLQNTKHW